MRFGGHAGVLVLLRNTIQVVGKLKTPVVVSKKVAGRIWYNIGSIGSSRDFPDAGVASRDDGDQFPDTIGVAWRRCCMTDLVEQ